MSAAPVLALMVLGVLVALVGHATRSNGTVLAGLLVLFAATALMVLGGFLAFQENPNEDPRPCTSQFC